MRAFVAIDVSQSVRAKLAALQAQLKSGCTGLRWSDADQIHVTLQFLGEVEESRVAAISKELRSVAGRHQMFDLSVTGLGAFPSARSVRVLWAGLEDGGGRLAALQRDCEQHLLKLGFAAERRPFNPHLTLARAKGDGRVRTIGDVIEKHAEFDGGQSDVSQLVLYESRLSPKGATYAAIERFGLAGSSSDS